MEDTHQQPHILKKLEFWLIMFVSLIIVSTAGYAVSYWITYQSKGEGTTWSQVKSDVLVEQESKSVEQQLVNLGYKPTDVVPLGTHRSKKYYADVLEGFTPVEQPPSDGPNSYLVQDNSGRYLYITVDENGKVTNVTELRQ